jgi:predicted metalloprotease
MRWDPDHQSADLIDRRGEGGGGLLMPLIFLLLRSPVGWVVLAILAVGWVIWQLFGPQLQRAGMIGGPGGPGNDEQAAFVGYVLDDVQDTWERKFSERGEVYERAKLVLFTGTTRRPGPSTVRSIIRSTSISRSTTSCVAGWAHPVTSPRPT